MLTLRGTCFRAAHVRLARFVQPTVFSDVARVIVTCTHSFRHELNTVHPKGLARTPHVNCMPQNTDCLTEQALQKPPTGHVG